MSETTEDTTVELEATVATEAVDKPKRHRAKSLSDAEFITLCNGVAMGDDPSIKAMMKATGFAESTVQARRSEINGRFRDAGKDAVLIPLETGGGKRSKNDELTDDDAKEAQDQVAAFLKAREAAKAEPETA